MTRSIFHGTIARRGAPALALLAAVAFGTTAAAAQSASIAGTVSDAATGQPVGGAIVLLANTPLSATTDSHGRFVIIGLAAGEYTLRVNAMGFSADSVLGIVLQGGERRDVVLTLDRIALRLQEVVVTASRTAERSDEAVASIAALPKREIIQRNVSKIDKALIFVPGVTLNSGSQLDIRGATGMARGIGSRVLVMFDGHPILTGNGGEIDFSTIPMLDLDRSEIVKGAYSAVYGSNALGGVVNLLTTPIDSTPQTVLRAHAAAYIYQQQYDWSDSRQGAIGLNLQHSRMLGNVGTRVALGYEGTNGFSENGESTRLLGRLKLTSDAKSAAPWDLYSVFVRERAGEFFTWRSADEPYLVPPAESGDHTITYTLLTGATVTPIAGVTTLFRVSPYFNFNRSENYWSDNDDSHNAYKPGFSSHFSWYTGRHAVTLGADGAHTWVQADFLGDPKILDLATFVQDELKLTETLKASLGVRLDHHKADAGDPEWAVSPKAGIALRVAPRATIRASMGAGYRAPSAIEQFVESQQSGFRVVPNPELRGEHAWSGEVGTTVTLLNRVRVDAAVFGSSFRDLIGPAPAPGQPFVFQFQNVSRARLVGVDIGISAHLVPDRLEAQTGYMFLESEDLDSHKPLPYRSRHNLTGTISAFQGLAAVDLRYRSRVEEVLAYPLDPRKDITIVDLRFGYQLLNVLWQFKVENVFNQFFVDVQERNPGAPRTIGITAVHGM